MPNPRTTAAVKSWAVVLVAVGFTAGGVGCASSGPPEVEPTMSDRQSEFALYATGRGAFPDDASSRAQARVLAREAARRDAQRKLSEQIYGLTVAGRTRVEEGEVTEDVIHSEVDATLRAAEVIESRYREDLEIVEVRMRVRLGDRLERLVLRESR